MDYNFFLIILNVISIILFGFAGLGLFSHYLKKTYNLIKSFLEAYYEN